MFFRKKRRDEVTKLAEAPKVTQPVEGTTPGVVEMPTASEQSLGAEPAAVETVAASVVAPKGETESLPAAYEDEDAVRLFPGFEHDDFEVGFRADQSNPALMLRWKDGDGDWFPVPPLFNRGILAAIDDRESSNDLTRLLRNYGYDIDASQD